MRHKISDAPTSRLRSRFSNCWSPKFIETDSVAGAVWHAKRSKKGFPRLTKGDSGGPLYFLDDICHECRKKTVKVIGIHSGSRHFTSSKSGHLEPYYVNVTEFVGWLESVIRKSDERFEGVFSRLSLIDIFWTKKVIALTLEKLTFGIDSTILFESDICRIFNPAL